MAVETLCILSMGAIDDFLGAKVWSSAENPISHLPREIVEELEVFIRSRRTPDHKKTYENLQLIFESGYVEKLDAYHWNSKQKQMRLPNILTKNCCKYLTSLSLPKHLYVSFSVKSILSSCCKLVEVHLPVFVDLAIFENCPQLKVLRFHASDDGIVKYFRQTTGNLPQTIRKLKVFSVCDTQVHYAITKDIIATLILNCPNLVSVGCCNSLDALQYIRETHDDLPGPFQFQRCYWGLKYSDFIPTPDSPEFERYQPQFSRMVKMASSMCSSLEELVIDVYDNNCVQHLVKLKNLTVLAIKFEDPYDDHYQPAFISLLREIGSQLKHLSVSALSPVPIDIICNRCRNLKTLRILGEMTIYNDRLRNLPDKKLRNLPHLKSLCVTKIEREQLLLLFQACPNIKDLYISQDLIPKGDFLKIISTQGASLEVLSVEECSLSQMEIRDILSSVPTLQKVSFDPILRASSSICFSPQKINFNLLRKLTNVKGIELDEQLHKKEYFRAKTHPCVF